MYKPFRQFAVLVMVVGICFFPAKDIFAEGESDTDKKEVVINLSPTGTLFDISNMKPGDWAPRIITIENAGSNDFDYQMLLQNSGDTKLFNKLLLEIKTTDKELYKGKLAAFESLPFRSLTSGSEENLDITIRFPEHLGNEFQGLETVFAFNFIAESKGKDPVQVMTSGQIESSGPTVPIAKGALLPATSTTVFNMLLVGSILVIGGIVLMIIMHYRRMKLAQ